MGFTYEELDFLGEKWKLEGESGVYLVRSFQARFGKDEKEAQEKVDTFFRHMMINRHKSICLPPQIHLTDYNTDGFNDSRPK